MKKKKTVFISGNFNLLHAGHIRLFLFAKELASNLIVAVSSDEIAGENAYLSENFRLEAISSLSYINKSFIYRKPINEIIKDIKPDFIVKGKEHENKYNEEEEIIKNQGGKIIFNSGEIIFSANEFMKKEIININNSISKNIVYPKDFLKRNNIKKEKLISIVNSFSNLNIIVVGDIIIDEYIDCKPIGMSQEDPTVVVTPLNSKKFIGGAAIVAAHAAGLNANVDFISVTGKDSLCKYSKLELKKRNVKFHDFIDQNRPTTLKKRYRSMGKTLLRVSELHQSPVSNSIQNKIFNKISKLIVNCDMLIFSDFNYGCLPASLVSKIIKLCNEKNVIMSADSQSSSQTGDLNKFHNMILVTPTEREARITLRDNENGLIVLAENLRKKLNAKNILLKLGKNGVIIHEYMGNKKIIKNEKIDALNTAPVDVAGAGDSMLVTASLALASKNNILEASILGSIAASFQVGKLGNIPLEAKELISFLLNR